MFPPFFFPCAALHLPLECLVPDQLLRQRENNSHAALLYITGIMSRYEPMRFSSIFC